MSSICIFSLPSFFFAIVFICLAIPLNVSICRAAFEPSFEVKFVEFQGLTWSPAHNSTALQNRVGPRLCLQGKSDQSLTLHTPRILMHARLECPRTAQQEPRQGFTYGPCIFDQPDITHEQTNPKNKSQCVVRDMVTSMIPKMDGWQPGNSIHSRWYQEPEAKNMTR